MDGVVKLQLALSFPNLYLSFFVRTLPKVLNNVLFFFFKNLLYEITLKNRINPILKFFKI